MKSRSANRALCLVCFWAFLGLARPTLAVLFPPSAEEQIASLRALSSYHLSERTPLRATERMVLEQSGVLEDFSLVSPDSLDDAHRSLYYKICQAELLEGGNLDELDSYELFLRDRVLMGDRAAAHALFKFSQLFSMYVVVDFYEDAVSRQLAPPDPLVAEFLAARRGRYGAPSFDSIAFSEAHALAAANWNARHFADEDRENSILQFIADHTAPGTTEHVLAVSYMVEFFPDTYGEVSVLRTQIERNLRSLELSFDGLVGLESVGIEGNVTSAAEDVVRTHSLCGGDTARLAVETARACLLNSDEFKPEYRRLRAVLERGDGSLAVIVDETIMAGPEALRQYREQQRAVTPGGS